MGGTLNMASPSSLFGAFISTLRTVASDIGVILLLVGAPVLYGFFYPWPYATQAVTRVETPKTVKAMEVDFEEAVKVWDKTAEFVRSQFATGE